MSVEIANASENVYLFTAIFHINHDEKTIKGIIISNKTNIFFLINHHPF